MKFDNAHLITAMVTPFDDQQHLDFDRLAHLIDHLLSHHTTGILVGGTTGEGPTLSTTEKLALYRETARLVAGRVPIIANTGSNNTAATIDFTRQVSQIAGIDAALVVVPPYNKPDQAGMIAHFTAIADRGGLPIIIYNIPGRVVVKMAVETIAKLAQHPDIIGIKQCTSTDELAAVIDQTPADFLVYTGEDAQTLTAQAYGAHGVISVASHLYGDAMSTIQTKLSQGDARTAGQLQRQLLPKMAALFSSPSPAPVKAALNQQRILVGDPRLPILPLTTAQQQTLLAALQ
ncbi:4-hydroxy-tetrahydrodipicolinate synthase [Lactobacillus sp.] [Lactiplantibacillus mudanjiangensis]|uniref:4-hydroxy-tetrahydrodipicolinate synthase n=1 Tax=Lactiplantibacillus mudanjiangensis TaxID=1296538 RepID=UPI001015BE95|nr:4-hydroxy-tetrahydrodipicolinate synthase [Lactiplantibacillus mudanjiangensis]VDG18892.1 4-hydroxy-tetrahydrodipicolinate synthase [Lactobacillus sp.] [Lactiplantibacillus mudanjiangensis]VDG32990.1 4-hydroxy-tetrahydrodipicolinate synthase [Lactobacillus sp.] [Lactiplantibacillus mudanjiangensis]